MKRFDKNPILIPTNKTWEKIACFNPSVIKQPKKYLMLYRAISEEMDYQGIRLNLSTIAIKGSQSSRTFTVKKEASDKVAVERIFPIDSPWIKSIKKLRSPKRKTRRAKLYFLRDPKARKT